MSLIHRVGFLMTYTLHTIVHDLSQSEHKHQEGDYAARSWSTVEQIPYG